MNRQRAAVNRKPPTKSILALVTLALVSVVLEEKSRQIAGGAPVV